LQEKAVANALRLRRVWKQVAGRPVRLQIGLRHVAMRASITNRAQILLARQILFVIRRYLHIGLHRANVEPLLAKVLGPQQLIDLPFVGAG